MNQVNLIGRVGGDIELKYTPSGKAVTEINLAVDDGFGENKKTAWIGVTLWGATAECAAKYVRKGDRLGVSGRLTQDQWEDKTTGKKQTKTKVTCENMHLITDKPKDERRETHQNGAGPPSRDNAGKEYPDDSDDIPFSPAR